MTKLLKYGFLLAFIVLALWGGWSLLHQPKDIGSSTRPTEGDSTLRRLSESASAEDDDVFLVVLDPGHGGKDPGAMAGEVSEKDINLAIALLVQEQLAAQDGVKVVMTREQDVFVELTDRAELANQEKADLYVSIHANTLENNDSYTGIYTFYHPNKSSDIAVAETIQAAVTSASGGIDRGACSEDYAVLRETEMPAVLIETGFMSCPEELALLQDENYQKLLAQGIAQGILDCRTA